MTEFFTVIGVLFSVVFGVLLLLAAAMWIIGVNSNLATLRRLTQKAPDAEAVNAAIRCIKERLEKLEKPF